jgi:hypothetical protein
MLQFKSTGKPGPFIDAQSRAAIVDLTLDHFVAINWRSP